MKKETFIELIISVAFVLLLILLLNPFNFWMPTSVQMMLIALVVIVFALFASFVWREKARDEREEYHKMTAGRIGYLAGIAILVLGVVVQAFSHTLDPWLVSALGVMVVTKIAALVYSRSTH
jgi:uncharacterized membrane protein